MAEFKNLGILLIVSAVVFAVAACGGGNEPEAPPSTTAPSQSPVETVAPTATVAPVGTGRPAEATKTTEEKLAPPAVAATPGPTEAPSPEEVVAPQGELIYQRTAGGIGCQPCHGVDATGLVGPDRRGRIASQVSGALEAVGAMSFITLTEAEIEAVAAYLQSLN